MMMKEEDYTEKIVRKIYSKQLPELVLFVVHTIGNVGKVERVDLTDKGEFLQCAISEIREGQTFKPHKHQPCQKTVYITQEAWVMIDGRMEVKLYDINDSYLETVILNSGDCLITFYGGHEYKCLRATTAYEFKNGPYFGQEYDKVFIKGVGNGK